MTRAGLHVIYLVEDFFAKGKPLPRVAIILAKHRDPEAEAEDAASFGRVIEGHPDVISFSVGISLAGQMVWQADKTLGSRIHGDSRVTGEYI